LATWGGTAGSNTRTLTYTIAAGQNGSATIDEAALKVALTAGISDAAGNAFSYTANAGVIANIDSTALAVIDTLAPTLAISSNVSAVKAGETATITFSFSEDPGSSFIASDAVVTTGGTLGAISGSGLTRTAVFTPTAGLASESASITVAADTYTDAAGNTGGAGSTPPTITIDTLAPSVTITDSTSNTADSGASVVYTFTFSEAVTGFDINDVTISAGTKGAFTTVSSSQYTLAVTMPTGTGSLTTDVAAGAATDAAGNANTAATQNAQAYFLSLAGQSVISLGAGNGQLINGVQVEGKWYYHWDRNNDGAADAGDRYSHNELDAIFKQDINGVVEESGNAVGTVGDTDNTYRYATLNDVKVALPTYGSTMSGNNASPLDVYKNGTSASLNPTADNATYDDLLAIWDNYNGATTGTDLGGVPPGWQSSFMYWSATPSASGHAVVTLTSGFVDNFNDALGVYVALQVL
jgi:hypothetical protein